jgi:predicted SprT family Zn-dependent metalloprotease
MRLTSAIRDFFVEQLSFEFAKPEPLALSPAPLVQVEPLMQAEDTEEAQEEESELPTGPAHELEHECRQLLLNLGIESATDIVKVCWNPRLRSTAGYAKYPSWRIELNPRLRAFDGQVDRTMRHELAHLVAYHRAGRRRIEPHGREWQQACADLGIPGEAAHHRLPLPRSQMRRPHAYQCPSCSTVVRRVRPFKRATACLACCRKHAGGSFDSRFIFVKQRAAEKRSD